MKKYTKEQIELMEIDGHIKAGQPEIKQLKQNLAETKNKDIKRYVYYMCGILIKELNEFLEFNNEATLFEKDNCIGFVYQIEKASKLIIDTIKSLNLYHPLLIEGNKINALSHFSRVFNCPEVAETSQIYKKSEDLEWEEIYKLEKHYGQPVGDEARKQNEQMKQNLIKNCQFRKK